jgi:hypothetical protein
MYTLWLTFAVVISSYFFVLTMWCCSFCGCLGLTVHFHDDFGIALVHKRAEFR